MARSRRPKPDFARSSPSPSPSSPAASSPLASGGKHGADAPTDQGHIQSLDELALMADQEAQKLLSPVVNTGHLLLAVLHATGSQAEKMLHDFGVEYASLATQVENLSRMDEGRLPQSPMTIKAQSALTGAMQHAAQNDAPHPDPLAAERLLHFILADSNTVAARSLERLRINFTEVRARMGHTLAGPVRSTSAPPQAAETAAASADGGDDAPRPAGVYRLTPEQYGAFPIDGDYESAAQKKPFHAKVSYGDVHIYSGWRFSKKAYEGEGNTVFFDKERLIAESIAFVRRMGEVELGSCAENRAPDPHTFEAFLRQFSINGNLASYLPAILDRLGAIRIEKRAKGIHWAVPADDLPRSPGNR